MGHTPTMDLRQTCTTAYQGRADTCAHCRVGTNPSSCNQKVDSQFQFPVKNCLRPVKVIHAIIFTNRVTFNFIWRYLSTILPHPPSGHRYANLTFWVVTLPLELVLSNVYQTLLYTFVFVYKWYWALYINICFVVSNKNYWNYNPFILRSIFGVKNVQQEQTIFQQFINWLYAETTITTRLDKWLIRLTMQSFVSKDMRLCLSKYT